MKTMTVYNFREVDDVIRPELGT